MTVYLPNSNRLQQVQAKIEGSEENFGKINTEVDSLRREINNCKDNIANLYNNYRESNTTYETECFTSIEFNTVLEVLIQAEQEYPILEIFDKAKSSVERSRYSNCKQIYSAFKAIAEVGKKYFQYQRQSISMGNGLEEEFRERGFVDNYRPTEHEATRNQYGDRREFCHGDRCVRILRHLTFNNNDCSLQIYFDFEFMQEQEKVIIGYCGKHLPIASQ